MSPPDHPALGSIELSQTTASIARTQRPDGAIPWWRGGRIDPWNHVEAAMALDAGGEHELAARAYSWSASTQRSDGAWPSSYRDRVVEDKTLDANFCCYVAAGVWHHWLATGDGNFLDRMWSTAENAVEFTLGLQRADGTIAWARDAAYRPWPGALLTSCSCIHLSLRCAISIAETLGQERPDWDLAAETLAETIESPLAFESRNNYSMDWYYPVLGGTLSESSARRRLREQWMTFVVQERGARCVADRPWVTTAETCELAIALNLVGMTDEAMQLLAWVQHLRTWDGSYWTGATFPDGRVWPVEKTTWSAAALLLAADALIMKGPASRFFRDVVKPSRPLRESALAAFEDTQTSAHPDL